MKKNISILVAVIGVLAGRALARQGNADIEIVVMSLASLFILAFSLYVYKKTHNLLFPLGCVLLIICLPLLGVLHDNIMSSRFVFWEIFSGLFFLVCLAVACMITGSHQIAPQSISRQKWKYWLMILAGFWIICCGGIAAVLFLLELPHR